MSENLRPYELQRVGMEIILRTDSKFLLDKRPETVAYARRAVEIFTRLRKPDSLTGAWAALQGVFSRNAGVRSQESEGSAQGAAAPSQESLTSPRRSVVRVLVERIAAA